MGKKLAIALAVLAGLLALTNVVLDYRSTGELDYGKIALAIGVPVLFYAILKSQGRKHGHMTCKAAYRPVFLPRFKATTSELSAH